MGEPTQRLTVHQDAELLVLTNDLHLKVREGQGFYFFSVSPDIIMDAFLCEMFSLLKLKTKFTARILSPDKMQPLNLNLNTHSAPCWSTL